MASCQFTYDGVGSRLPRGTTTANGHRIPGGGVKGLARCPTIRAPLTQRASPPTISAIQQRRIRPTLPLRDLWAGGSIT